MPPSCFLFCLVSAPLFIAVFGGIGAWGVWDLVSHFTRPVLATIQLASASASAEQPLMLRAGARIGFVLDAATLEMPENGCLMLEATALSDAGAVGSSSCCIATSKGRGNTDKAQSAFAVRRSDDRCDLTLTEGADRVRVALHSRDPAREVRATSVQVEIVAAR